MPKRSREPKSKVSPVVDPADVKKLVDVLIRRGVVDPIVAYDIALVSQGQMTTGYAKEFARRVRQSVQWAKSAN